MSKQEFHPGGNAAEYIELSEYIYYIVLPYFFVKPLNLKYVSS
jgi:hypothetical protein